MNLNERLALIKQVGEEIVTEEDLTELLKSKPHPIAYDGFEPSGRMHIAQGLLRAINVNKMIKAGCKFKMLVADWHAWANNKFGGDLEKIQTAGKYMIELWKASGMDLKNVEFVWVNSFIKDDNYWKLVMQIARNSTVQRIIRCSQIMGRKEGEVLQASQILYPLMQCADIFYLKADICQLGMDQRKVNVLARELAPKLNLWKPVAVHHHMLMGLGKPPESEAPTIERAIELKMSKSKPETAIFMDDNDEDIKRKVANAYCPEKQIQENPIIEYCKYILFELFKEIKIEREAKFGGNLIFKSFDELAESYSKGALHPMDLKAAVSRHIIEALKPIRRHFESNAAAKKLQEKVKSFEVTR